MVGGSAKSANAFSALHTTSSPQLVQVPLMSAGLRKCGAMEGIQSMFAYNVVSS